MTSGTLNKQRSFILERPLANKRYSDIRQATLRHRQIPELEG